MKRLKNILKRSLEELKPLYIISSSDRFILNDFKNKFIDRFIAEEIRDFNYTYLEEGDKFPAVLKNQANTPPVMSSRRFIIARTVDYFTAKQKKEELIVKLFNNFPETTIMIILVDGKANGKLKIVKEAKKIGSVINVSAPKYNQLDKWIKIKFDKKGKKIDKKGINFLERMFNNNLQLLGSEIEKICLYKYHSQKIYLEDILEIVSRDRLIEDDLVFSLTDALIAREPGKAVSILKQMIRGGTMPLMLLGTIAWQIKLLLMVKVLKQKGKNPSEIARIIKSHPYPVKKCYSKTNSFSEAELEVMLENLLEANVNIISGRFDPELALEMAIVRI